jgi:hypothetical protein
MQRFQPSPADWILFGLANAAMLFTLGYDLTGLDVAYRNGFAIEDGPVEWGTAIGLLIAGVVLLRNAVTSARRGGTIAATGLTVLYGALFLFAAGEEISWGQRLFGWQPPAFFAENNAQRETNIHNLVVGDVKLVKTVFGAGLSAVLLLYLVVLPPLYRAWRPIRRVIDALAIPVPGLRHTAVTVAATALMVVVDLQLKWETYEFVFSLLAISIFLAPQNTRATR